MTTPDHKLSFKTGMRTLAHTVTSQAHHPLLHASSSSAAAQPPLFYYEVKIHKMQDKEVNRFALGLAKHNYPYLRLVGTKDSVAIRGDGKVFVNDSEEKPAFGAPPLTEKSLLNCVVGVGYESRQGRVFFTLNGREIYQVQDT